MVFLFCFSLSSFSQSQVLQLYMQNFLRADLVAKAELLKKAEGDAAMSGYTGQFYEYALQFAADNTGLLKNDPDMIKIVGIAADGLGKTGYSESLDVLWGLFLEYQDVPTGAEILIAIGKLGKENKYIINNINDFLMEKNDLFIAGNNVNYATISACIAAILELGDSSSYPALFAVLCANYPEIIEFEAHGAFELIPGNFRQFLLNIIEKSPPEEKFIAFKAGINSKKLSPSERGQLAEAALEQSLVLSGIEDNADLFALRYEAVLALTPLRWTRANALAIRHYYRVQTDYQHNAAPKERLLEAIALLGASGNSEAALVLGLQLGLINARTERTFVYDEEITLAIVQSLGLIGDKAAFDHLLYVSMLSYPDDIQAAAKEAITRLKW